MDDDGILTDEEVVVPPVEVRVPDYWTSKISTRALGGAAPLGRDAVLSLCAKAVAGRAREGAEGSSGGGTPSRAGTFPQYVYEWLQAKQGSHKATENQLASLINGVEAHWTSHSAVQLFGELCGMFPTAELSEVVNRRVLGLLAPEPADPPRPPLVPLEAIAPTLAAETGRARTWKWARCRLATRRRGRRRHRRSRAACSASGREGGRGRMSE